MTEKTQNEFPKEGQHEGGTIEGYTIEIRNRYRPCVLDGDIIDGEWRHHEFKEGLFGIRNKNQYKYELMERYKLLNFSAAQAFRWCLIANIQSRRDVRLLGIETRLVRHKVTYSSACEAVAAISHTK